MSSFVFFKINKITDVTKSNVLKRGSEEGGWKIWQGVPPRKTKMDARLHVARDVFPDHIFFILLIWKCPRKKGDKKRTCDHITPTGPNQPCYTFTPWHFDTTKLVSILNFFIPDKNVTILLVIGKDSHHDDMAIFFLTHTHTYIQSGFSCFG